MVQRPETISTRKGSRHPEPLVPEKAQGQGTINFRTAQGLGTTGPRKAIFLDSLINVYFFIHIQNGLLLLYVVKERFSALGK
jgi:hypothetical protein